jgi:hypothetical protein
MKTYEIEIEGTTPLLMHRDNIDWSDQMDAWKSDPANKKGSKAGDDRSPAFRWIGSLYSDGQVISIDSENISRCLMEAGAMVPVPGTGKKTFKAQTQSGMKVDQLSIPLLVKGKPIPFKPIENLLNENDFAQHRQTATKLGFELFLKRAKIGQAKHVRVRPKFLNWALAFTVTVWDEQITADVLKNVFQYAGAYKGLCDWRPGGKTPGSYGMFTLKSMRNGK